MDRMQMVEKLREKANISYEQARDVLEKSNWDLLEALVQLENKGVPLGKTKREQQFEARQVRKSDTARTLSRVGKAIAAIIEKGNSLTISVKRNDKVLFGVPLTAFVLLLVFMFWWVVPAMLVGLFFHFQYSLSTPDREVEGVNRVMEKASELADNLRQKAEEVTEKK